jgi:crossover junction endodeoxyribonuclease RuvC
MVTRLLALAHTPRPADAADALALALCHLSGARFEAALPRSPGDARPHSSRFERAVAAAVAREEGS